MAEQNKEITIKLSRNVFLASVVIIVFAFGFLVGGLILRGGPTGAATGNAPQRVQVSVDDDPLIGDRNAKITIIEFSDFQCPFCRKFYTETLSQLEKDYVDTGKVNFVYRDFPLDNLHPSARLAAEAAECADEQGKWKEMHNIIFEKQNELGTGTVSFDIFHLKEWVLEIVGLDSVQFDRCLDSGKYAQEVQKDSQDGINAGVTGTPTFFIGNPQEGYIPLVGAQPYSVFKQVLDGLV